MFPMNNILMNNTSFLLSATKIISRELRNLTEFKQCLIQLSCKSPRLSCSKNHFHQHVILVVRNHWYTEFPPRYTMMKRPASHSQLT